MRLVITTRVGLLKKFIQIIMSNNDKSIYYAVVRGDQTGIYNTWQDCENLIKGYSNAKFRKFYSFAEAQEFLNFWKNYSSPATPKYKKYENSFKNNTFVLGSESSLNNNTESKANKLLEAYVSPINCSTQLKKYKSTNLNEKQIKTEKDVDIIPSEEQNEMLNFCEIICKTEPISCQIISDENQSNLEASIGNQSNNKLVSRSFTEKNNKPLLDCCDSPNVVEKYSNSVVNALVNSNNSNDNEDVIFFERIIKNNDTIINSTNCNQIEKEMNNSGYKYKECLKLLKSALDLSMANKANISEKINKFTQALIKELLTLINSNVNSQIVQENDESRNSLDVRLSENCTNDSTDVLETSSSSQSRPQQSFVNNSENSKISPNKEESREKLEVKNIDMVALNVRLDSFDRRFDACLKDIGGIMSELHNIKSDISDIKNLLTSELNLRMPKTTRGGTLQSAFNLNQKLNNSSSSHDYNTLNSSFQTSSSRFYSKNLRDDNSDSDVKKTKRLKRKLSRSDSNPSSGSESNKEKDELDISSIKTEAVDYTSFSVDKNEYVQVYTDGTCLNNGKKEARAGIGIWFGDSHPLNVSEPLVGSPTNNCAEIQAARVAMELAIKAGIKKLKIFTDSSFLINCATKWIRRWKKNGWTLVDGGKVKNREELEKLDLVAQKLKVKWEKVEGHSGIKGNEMADRLANAGALKFKKSIVGKKKQESNQ
ncbi:asparagine-rich protein, putative [Pediculus humanus corporis]|uniref:Ribonuclease H n=1 Tax=Pediculus humanus subsp. corporis TaxID=121224 RepID=E0VG24_PEDHC|nr:asparagine-rich protein, putative [Pediculus humanus corporis]EEB12330.1 asparagine-rich protein, putative [Pediculus humanus corporis]